MKILVTGSDGLVGNAIKKIISGHPDFNFIFVGKKDFDLTKIKSKMFL